MKTQMDKGVEKPEVSVVVENGANPKSRVRARTISLKLASLLVVLAVAGTAMALTINSLTAEDFTFYNQANTPGDFTVTAQSWDIIDKNSIDISVTVTNGDGVNAHFANITVMLLDGAGDLVAGGSLTIATGSVAASGTDVNVFSYNVAGIVAAFVDVFIEIDQSS